MSRPAPFSLRLTAEERTALEAKAGSLPLASYIKSVVLDEHAVRYRKRRTMPEKDMVLLAQILAQLGKGQSAASLAQIADGLANGALILDDALAEELHQAIVDVAWMRATLMRALRTRPSDEEPA